MLCLFTRPGAEELVSCTGPGFETNGLFASHLWRYLPLFTQLPFVELVCIANASTRVDHVQSVFERVLSRGSEWLTKAADPDRFLAHFHGRQLFEKRGTSSFDAPRLDALRDDMDCCSGRHFAQMFARWKASGDEAIRAEIAAQKMPNGRFSSCILSYDYDLFGLVEATS